MDDACIYTRISHDPKKTDDGDEPGDGEGMGVARQEQDCRTLAERNEWSVSQVYSDNDISAYNGAVRPRFEAMLDAIKRGQHNVLVCWHTDRLYRSVKDMERVIEVCETAGVPIRSVNGGDLDLCQATGKAVARILGSVAGWSRSTRPNGSAAPTFSAPKPATGGHRNARSATPRTATSSPAKPR